MELDELLQHEGVDDVQGTLSWARDRAEELVAGLVADTELGPLLDAEFAGLGGSARRVAQASESEAQLGTTPAANLAAPVSSDAESAAADVRADGPVAEISAVRTQTAAGLPPLPQRPDLPEVGPGVNPDPMADAAYDQDSGAHAMPAEQTAPVVTVIAPAPVEAAAQPVADEVTQPRVVAPTRTPDETPMTHTGSIEIDEDEIELLDDDDLELVEDDGEDEPLAAFADGSSEAGVPEWRAALTSASMGGGAQADEDSGLHRIGPDSVQTGLTDPEEGALPMAPVPQPADDDSEH